MKLLIVDDEMFAVQGIMDGVRWEELSFDTVLRAYSYAQAVEAFQGSFVDVLLCDIEMPDGSGLELVDYVNRHSPGTQCVILSCHDEFDFARQAVKLSCLDYVLKPVRYDELTGILKNAIAAAEARSRRTMMESLGQQYVDSVARKNRTDASDAAGIVMDYIASHLDEELSVKQLAALAYVSPDHLTRVFKKKFGKSIPDMILERRMALAGELLRKGDLSIAAVSGSVGFSNYSYFSEQFKRFYGMTPRGYQKQSAGKKETPAKE